MQYRWGIVVIVLMMSVLCSAEEKETSLVTRPIKIQGQKHITLERLYEVLSVERKSFFAFWKEDRPRIKEKLIPTLLSTLKSFYNSEGFYNARFKLNKSDEVLVLEIKENRPVKIKKIDIQSDFPIQNFIKVKKGEIFRSKTFIETKNGMIQALLNKGYCSYDLETKAYVDLQKHSVDIRYRLKKGDICTFGDTIIKGLKSIDPEIIKTRVVAKKGERYDPQKIQESYARVFDLDAFDSIILGTDRKFYNEVPVDITLTELSQPYHYEVGAGYDTFVGARVHGMISKRNFLSNAQKITLRGSWSQREQLITLDFFKPVLFRAFGYGVDFGSNIGYSNLEFIGFKEEKSFLRTYLQSHEGRLSLNAGLAVENINISLLNNFRRNQNLLQAVKEGNFLLFYPYIHAIYDARDSKLNPKYGYYLSAYTEYGLPYGSDAGVYLKTLLEGRVIHTIGDLTLANVSKYGVVDIAANEIPASKLLYAGGAFFNRAYGFRQIGVIESNRRDSIEGGLSMLNFSFEANYPLWKNIYGALFSDHTMITDKSYNFSGNYIHAAGVGLRYMTPIGPFKVDIGWNIHDTSQYGISFQIGQSF